MQPRLTDRIVDIDRMDETTVVPQQQIADTPLMVVLIFGSRYALVDLVQQVIAFHPLPSNDVVRAVCIEIERFPACVFMRAHQWMDDVRRLVGLCLGTTLGAAWRAYRIVAMHGLQAVELALAVIGIIEAQINFVPQHALGETIISNDGTDASGLFQLNF